jgi:hypothetical protein
MRIATVAAASCLVLGLASCASDPNDVSYGNIVRNPNPELKGTAMTDYDADRSFWYMANANGRSLYDDTIRALYVDQPSRLSPFPISSRNGQPR